MQTVSAPQQSPHPPPLVSAHLRHPLGPEYLRPRTRIARGSPPDQLILRCAALRLGSGGPRSPPGRAGGAAGTGAGGQGWRLRLKVGVQRPRDVRTIFQQADDPRVPEERGEGHRFFRPCALHTWCDLCGRAIGPGAPAVRCHNCNYTAHQGCRNFIKLDCQQWEQLSEESIAVEVKMVQPESENVATKEEEKPLVLTEKEIKQKIAEYNGNVKNCLGMRLNSDGSYTGFIKVHLKLRRPVTVPAGIRPQSIYDVLKEVNPAEITDKRTSFYLPLDAIKQLHISGSTTANQVIIGLLKKFMVIDNPQKYALFYQTKKGNDVHLQKLKGNEQPLLIRLLAGPDTEASSFALKENETGEVEWDAFSVPELQNFLIILEKEEKERIHQAQQKFVAFRQKLEQALKAAGKPG
ncbi:ras association domain-containing protein 5 isoform X1 [Amblyraja radiata]|uniref:ras association domain-containing protein 5 isoform X1 n=1 Tax=Amblyraja radiata TaxID=386614 RepID=UPI001401E3B2|nr:ras association domain-containing protein 5 isoform X1 [Amblyraja radiata]